LFEGHELSQISGLGNKVIELVKRDLVFLSKAGPGFWDVCAGHCLVNELGGGFSYVDGNEITYMNNGERQLMKGCIMSLSKEKLAKFLEKFEKSEIKL
jgi:3'-phosphoadenosine 5'-phosphosulfate (PAPS) 3'-phosphatase